MSNSEIFKIVEFRNEKGQRRYMMIWRETGEIAEDYQGYGTKDEEVLIRRQSAIMREVREKFCREHRELLDGSKNTKEVQSRLEVANIALPLGLTYLKVFREIGGSNRQARETYRDNNTDSNGNYYKTVTRKGHVYEYVYDCDGELTSYSVDGNDLF